MSHSFYDVLRFPLPLVPIPEGAFAKGFQHCPNCKRSRVAGVVDPDFGAGRLAEVLGLGNVVVIALAANADETGPTAVEIVPIEGCGKESDTSSLVAEHVKQCLGEPTRYSVSIVHAADSSEVPAT